MRALDSDGDWTFGKGQNDYKNGVKAVVENVNTRLNEFLGDCFFNTAAGLDWFGLIGGKDTKPLNLAVSAVILNTEDITGILQLTTTLTSGRSFTVNYQAETSFGTAASSFVFDPALA